jgi:hypothetical protein
MSQQIKYSLTDLWKFPDKQIVQILEYFNHQPSSSSLNNRLDAIILSYNNNILKDEDIIYVENNQFDDLFLSSSDQLIQAASDLGYTSNNYDPITLIKYIIDQYNIIKVVDQIPTQFKNNLELYQINNNLFVCGSGTFAIKDKLKALNGKWDAKNKCWSLATSARYDLNQLVKSQTSADTMTLQQKQLHDDIPLVTKIPKTIPHNLQLYQIKNAVVLCGKKTYDIKEELKTIGSTFNRTYQCWYIPNDRIEYAMDLVNQNTEKDILSKKETQEKRKLTMAKKAEDKRIIDEQNQQIRDRLSIKEPELPFTQHMNRLYVVQMTGLGPLDDKTYDTLERQDISELKRIWKDKINYVDYEKAKEGKYYYVTYTGDYRPPDLALFYFVNEWQPLPKGSPAYSSKRVDYKIYEIYHFSTD